MNRRGWRRTGIALVAAGAVVLATVSLGAPTAGAAGGNNGTVKIDGSAIGNGGGGNDPHVGCAFFIQWSGFDPGPPKAQATVSFDAQPPTGNVNLLSDAFTFTSNNGTAGKQYDLSNAIQAAGLTPHQQGYHISVTINTTDANGSDVKAKTYWVQACVAPTVTPATCQAAGGQPGISLAIKNNDFDQSFDVFQDGNFVGNTGTILAGATATFPTPPNLLTQNPAAPTTIRVVSTTNATVFTQFTIPATACAQVGSITISKSLSGGAAPPPNTLFSFTVTCPAGQGIQVVAQPVQVSQSTSPVTVATNVPFGTTCQITENNPPAAPNSTSFTVNNPQAAGNGAGPVAVGPNAAHNPGAVTFTNTFPAPNVYSVRVRKLVTGQAAPANANTLTFPFSIVCPGGGNTFPQSVSQSQGYVLIASNVPVGTDCTITETNTNGATTTTHTGGGANPGTSATATAIAPDIDFTNTYDPVLSSVTLQKLLAGQAQPANTTQFTFSVNCTDLHAQYPLGQAPATFNLSPSQFAQPVATNVTVGTSCTITETDAKGATATTNSSATPNSMSGTVSPSNANPAALTFTNQFDPPPTASITLKKQLNGAAAPLNDPTFQFTVTCNDQGATVTSPVSLKASDPATTVATNVGLNTNCTITETTTNGATGVSYTVNGAGASNTNSVTVTPTSKNTVAVVAINQYDPGQAPVPPPSSTTTTTAPPTTTTVPPTTTTAPPTTTTAPPTTTTAPPTTTTAAPAQVLGEEISRGPAVLARTGIETQRRILVGIALMFIGLTLLGFSRGIELVVAGNGVPTVAEPERGPQHAAPMTFVSRAWLSAAVAAAAVFGISKRK